MDDRSHSHGGRREPKSPRTGFFGGPPTQYCPTQVQATSPNKLCLYIGKRKGKRGDNEEKIYFPSFAQDYRAYRESVIYPAHKMACLFSGTAVVSWIKNEAQIPDVSGLLI
jgi:hypothetical protein